MNAVLFTLLLLIITIAIIFYYRNTKTEFAESNGTFDLAARQQYKHADLHAKRGDPRGHFDRARIAVNNIVRGGHQYNRAIIQQIDEDYKVALANVRDLEEYTPEFIADQAIQWWILNDVRAPAVYTEVVTQNREAKRAKVAGAKNKQEAVAAYLTAPLTSDNQNVHDSSVNNDLRRMLDIIERDNEQYGVAVSPSTYEREIREAIGKLPTDRQQAAKTTLAAMLGGVAVSTYNTTEPNVLYNVWSRTHHPANIANKTVDNLRESIVDALYDASKDGTVCVNGRCGRVIEALAAVDSDRRLDGVKTTEAYKAEIFDRARQLIDSHVESIKDVPAMSEIYKSYSDPSVDPPQEQVERFKAEVSANIDKLADEYTGRVPAPQLATILVDAKSAI